MGLSQKRAADREEMARQMTEIAGKFGATVERECLPGRETYLRIRLPGAYVAMGFCPEAERKGAGWGFLGHWVCERGHLFSVAFQGPTDRFPHHKATTSADDFEVFAALIQNRLRQVAAGRAFAQVPA